MEQLVKIPPPAIERLSYLYEVLFQFEGREQFKVSSVELGESIGQAATTIRKDIHLLGYNGSAGARYDVRELKGLIGERLGFVVERAACIVGMGALGSALLNHFTAHPGQGVRIVAGFDSNVNRLETITTSVELFPAYRLEEVIARKSIALAVIAVPPAAAQEVADRCCSGGVSGILTFSPVQVRPVCAGVSLRSFDIACEMRILTAHASLNRAGVSQNDKQS